jgi:hypothetical protein
MLNDLFNIHNLMWSRPRNHRNHVKKKVKVLQISNLQPIESLENRMSPFVKPEHERKGRVPLDVSDLQSTHNPGDDQVRAPHTINMDTSYHSGDSAN